MEHSHVTRKALDRVVNPALTTEKTVAQALSTQFKQIKSDDSLSEADREEKRYQAVRDHLEHLSTVETVPKQIECAARYRDWKNLETDSFFLTRSEFQVGNEPVTFSAETIQGEIRQRYLAFVQCVEEGKDNSKLPFLYARPGEADPRIEKYAGSWHIKAKTSDHHH